MSQKTVDQWLRYEFELSVQQAKKVADYLNMCGVDPRDPTVYRSNFKLVSDLVRAQKKGGK